MPGKQTCVSICYAPGASTYMENDLECIQVSQTLQSIYKRREREREDVRLWYAEDKVIQLEGIIYSYTVASVMLKSRFWL